MSTSGTYFFLLIDVIYIIYRRARLNLLLIFNKIWISFMTSLSSFIVGKSSEYSRLFKGKKKFISRYTDSINRSKKILMTSPLMIIKINKGSLIYKSFLVLGRCYQLLVTLLSHMFSRREWHILSFVVCGRWLKIKKKVFVTVAENSSLKN